MLNFATNHYKGIIGFASRMIILLGGLFGLRWNLYDGGDFALGVFSMIIGMLVALICDMLIIPPIMLLFSINTKLDEIKKIMEKNTDA